MRPRPDQQTGRPPRATGCDRGHGLVLVEGAFEKDVVPAADVERVRRYEIVGVGRPRPAAQRSVRRSVHRGDDLAHHAAGQVAELPQRQQVEQLTGGQLRRRLSQ